MGIPNSTNIIYEAMRNNIMPRAFAIKRGSTDLNIIKESLKTVKIGCKKANCCKKAKEEQQNLL